MKITMTEETYTAISDAPPDYTGPFVEAKPTVYYAEYDAHKEKTISLWVGLVALWVMFWAGYYFGMMRGII